MSRILALTMDPHICLSCFCSTSNHVSNLLLTFSNQSNHHSHQTLCHYTKSFSPVKISQNDSAQRTPRQGNYLPKSPRYCHILRQGEDIKIVSFPVAIPAYEIPYDAALNYRTQGTGYVTIVMLPHAITSV